MTMTTSSWSVLIKSGFAAIMFALLFISEETTFGPLKMLNTTFWMGIIAMIIGMVGWNLSKQRDVEAWRVAGRGWITSAGSPDEQSLRLDRVRRLGVKRALAEAGILGTGVAAAAGASWWSLGSGEDSSNSAPAFNVDGSPMLGAFDINGNAYGVSSSMNNGPCVNIDGTPMVGDSGVDMNGNIFGITHDTFGHNEFMCDMSTSGMDFSSNDYGMSLDPFSV